MKQKYCKRAQAKQTHFFPSTGAKYTGTVDSLGFNVYLHGEIEYESSKEIKKRLMKTTHCTTFRNHRSKTQK